MCKQHNNSEESRSHDVKGTSRQLRVRTSCSKDIQNTAHIVKTSPNAFSGEHLVSSGMHIHYGIQLLYSSSLSAAICLISWIEQYKKIILAFRAVAPAIASIAFDFWFLRSSCPLFRALQPTCKWRNSSRKTQAATLYRTRWTCWSTSCSVGDKQMRLATGERYNFLLLMRGTIWKRKMQ